MTATAPPPDAPRDSVVDVASAQPIDRTWVQWAVTLDVPEGEETDTIGGLIAEMLDRMPEVGDQVQLECTDREHKDEDDLPIKARLSLKVAKMDQYRVERVVVVRLAQEPEDDDDPDEEPVRYETVEEDGMAENQDAGLDTALKDGGER